MPALRPVPLLLVVSLFAATAPPSRGQAAPTPAAGDTVAHRLLAAEREANGAPAADYAPRVERLNLLLDEAVARVRALHADEASPEGVTAVFAAVDRVLVDRHYNVFIQTDTLWDALTPGIPASGGRLVLTDAMRAHRAANPEAEYYRFDCDTGAFIYLGVFERLGKPVVLVEVPRHYFLRWRLGPDRHVNWDVNDGRAYTDDDYRAGTARTARRSGFDRAAEAANHYLRDMGPDEVRAYHLTIVAGAWSRRGRFDRAAAVFEEAAKLRPYSTTPRNNFAWMVATQPDLQRADLLDRALAMARAAVALRPADPNLKDTLAAVHAARREFDRAIEVERGGADDPERIKAYTSRRTPVELDWRSEPD